MEERVQILAEMGQVPRGHAALRYGIERGTRARRVVRDEAETTGRLGHHYYSGEQW